MPADRNERFIVIEQQQPIHYLTVVHSYKNDIPQVFNSVPLRWELIDRGEDFKVMQEDNSKFKTIGRYTTQEEASDMRKLLLSL